MTASASTTGISDTISVTRAHVGFEVPTVVWILWAGMIITPERGDDDATRLASAATIRLRQRRCGATRVGDHLPEHGNGDV